MNLTNRNEKKRDDYEDRFFLIYLETLDYPYCLTVTNKFTRVDPKFSETLNINRT